MNYCRLGPEKGKKILIIGGCGGIGQAVIEGAIAHELEIAVFDLPISIKRCPPPKNVKIFEVDATKMKDLAKATKQLMEHWQSLDYLVNLVGFITEFNPITNYSESGWGEMIDGNLKSCFLSCKAIIPHLNEGGAIVNMSSGLGFVGREGYAPYSAAKAALVALTKTLATELAPAIRVNAVAPGAVQTAFLSGGLAHSEATDKAAKRLDIENYKKIVPLQEIAQAREIALPILFLLGNAARHITGETLHINGGALMV